MTRPGIACATAAAVVESAAGLTVGVQDRDAVRGRPNSDQAIQRPPGSMMMGRIGARGRAAGDGGRAGEPVALPSEAGLALDRTAQEALTNIRKHAPGAGVLVRLSWRPDGARLVVEDDGAAPASHLDGGVGGYGLAGVAERAQLLGAQFSAGPTATGFRVELTIPVPA